MLHYKNVYKCLHLSKSFINRIHNGVYELEKRHSCEF